LSGQATLFPLEFYIEGAPKSHQASARSKEQWRATVRRSALDRVRETVDWSFLEPRRVAVTIYYFPPAEMQGDVDNIVKPILDGMINVAYLDDRAVERVLVQKFEPGIERSFADVTQKLQDALRTKAPVVYIRVDDDLSWRIL
jgi:Holliday junction resolvase RusA-like endonuclease